VRALEDLGYFCVDNLPIQLIPTMAELVTREGAGLEKVAIVADVREKAFLTEFVTMYRVLKAGKRLTPTLIFLEASHAALVRRFSETRRPHPLAPNRSVSEGITEERQKLSQVRRMADVVVDTTNQTVHELRATLTELQRGGQPGARMVVTLMSFGFKRGVPLDADLVFDVRCLPNPHFVDRLRPMTGRDAPVARFLRRHEVAKDFVDRMATFLRFALPKYVEEGKTYLTVAVGCTGGRHRSVWVGENLKTALRHVAGISVRVTHRDLGN
jgi:UPF0042 nucleotide-binding protein